MIPTMTLCKKLHLAVLFGLSAFAAGCGSGASLLSDPETYEGQYRVSCFLHQWVHDGALAGPAVMATAEFTLLKTGDNALSFKLTQHYFSSSDTTCSGKVLTTETSAGNRFDFNGQTLVNYHGSPTAAMRIRATYKPANSNISDSAPVVLGALAYPADYFTETRYRKYLLMLDGKDLYFGNEDKGKDTEGFPKLLEDGPGAVRY